jgi:uncharacterized protein
MGVARRHLLEGAANAGGGRDTGHDRNSRMSLAPVARAERIEALDVVRGFALIGILLMNIEYFNRATSDIGTGLQPGLSGANYWFSWFVQYFVVGKFWTIFSLLFGMGFAVMLTRAEAAQRSFLVPYARRIAALALFGALHFILLWPGDILFSYAVGAFALLVVLYGRATFILLAMLLLAGAGAVSGWEWPFVIAGSLAYYGLCAWYLRCPERITVFGRSFPVFKVVTRTLMTLSTLALLAGLFAPGMPHEARMALPIIGGAILVLSVLMARYHQPVAARPWRMGVALYLFGIGIMTSFGAAQYYFPDPNDAIVARQAIAAPVKEPKTDLERAAERHRKRTEMRAEKKAEMENEVRVLTRGSYADAVAMRAKEFVKHAPEQFAFATLLIAMFLLGVWFVRAGIMTNTAAHLPLFRKLATRALPLGLGMGLAGSLIATCDTPGVENGFEFAFGLLMLGNLAACLGYVSVIVLMLHSGTALARVRVLGPFGRMALTNYLTHSLVFTTVFYGYGLGYFGIERIWQFACVVLMVAFQIPFSHWWLARFRYGPMEWLWRAITYWQFPPMRLAVSAPTSR